jgi:hypothetical protein
VTQRRLVAAALTLVVLAVIGLIYLQVVAQSRATRDVWLLTHDVSAGALLDGSNVKKVRVPLAGDQFSLLQESPLQRRTAHRLSAQSLLRPDDLLGSDTAQVPVSVRSAPSVGVGDSIDVYAVVGSRTVLVGRRLVVAATGNPMTLVVSASDEPYWIALQANNVSLFAAKSGGVGVPGLSQGQGVGVTEAVANLSGSALSGPVLTSPGTSGLASPTPPTQPTATPVAPTPLPSPTSRAPAPTPIPSPR